VRDKNIGVFVGVGVHGGFLKEGVDLPPGADVFIASGASTAIVANRLSFCLKLKGSSFSIDTACSSALVALDSGCKDLRLQACAAALCGGVQISDTQATLVMTLAHELSSLGRCATFDGTADGFVRGEGVGAFWLNLASNHSEINEVASIQGIDVQHAGRSVSLTAPSGNAQQTVLRSALSASGCSSEEIALVECHGTGTALGDALEVGALRTVMNKSDTAKPLLLGTVKTNVAHTEGASGAVGLITAIQQMSRACTTANLHLRQLNEHLQGDGHGYLLFPVELCKSIARA